MWLRRLEEILRNEGSVLSVAMRFSQLILGAFAKMRKATISYVMSVCPSRIEQLGLHWTEFHEI
jgi:hypothetical protein